MISVQKYFLTTVTISDLNRAVLIFKRIIVELKDSCMVLNANRKRYEGFWLYVNTVLPVTHTMTASSKLTLLIN